MEIFHFLFIDNNKKPSWGFDKRFDSYHCCNIDSWKIHHRIRKLKNTFSPFIRLKN